MGGSESRVARYSIEHREWVARQMMPPLNRTVPELVEATGITDATLYAWRKQARAAGVVVPEMVSRPTSGRSRTSFGWCWKASVSMRPSGGVLPAQRPVCQAD